MGKLFANGINQEDLVTAIEEIVTDWNATMALLDADSAVNGENYASLWNMVLQDYITDTGIRQGELVAQLQNMVSCINGVCAKLDLDSGVADNDYASLWAITDKINESTYPNDILNNGLRQGDLINLLSDIKDTINGIQAKLVADATVNTKTYASANPIAFTIDTTGT